MQINRLLEIVYILLDKKTVTAKELSVHFEVSPRTIYRDVEVLSAAGIPIYTNKGKGGGISLLENYVLSKAMLSEREQIDILSSLQGLNALNVPDVEPILNKLAVLFNMNNLRWIDVDFSHWSSNVQEQEKFNILKSAILSKKIVTFDYFSSYGEKTNRTVEPLRILFKGQGWYLHAFCRTKNKFRIFKITRIKNLILSKDIFQRDVPKEIWNLEQNYNNVKMLKLVLKIEAKMAYRLYDEFDQENIEKNDDGSYQVSKLFPEGEWLYEYILSYGDLAEVIEPVQIREAIKRKFEEGLKKYL